MNMNIDMYIVYTIHLSYYILLCIYQVSNKCIQYNKNIHID